jgi:hypothetical protein
VQAKSNCCFVVEFTIAIVITVHYTSDSPPRRHERMPGGTTLQIV